MKFSSIGSSKFALAVAAAALVACAGSASAAGVVVGGISFSDSLLPGHLETTTVAETLITANGQVLQGYGVVNTVNGVANYCAVGTCQLYFTFDNYISQNLAPSTVEFSGGKLSVFFHNGPALNLTSTASATNFATISGFTKWAQFTGVSNLASAISVTSTLLSNGAVTGSGITFTGGGLAEVNAGWGNAAVEAFLNGNSEFNAIGYGADITLTTSGSNAYSRIPQIDRAACWTGNPQQGGQFIGQAGDWCIQGSADVSGTTVPEPTSLALVSLALLGLAGAARRRLN